MPKGPHEAHQLPDCSCCQLPDGHSAWCQGSQARYFSFPLDHHPKPWHTGDFYSRTLLVLGSGYIWSSPRPSCWMCGDAASLRQRQPLQCPTLTLCGICIPNSAPPHACTRAPAKSRRPYWSLGGDIEGEAKWYTGVPGTGEQVAENQSQGSEWDGRWAKAPSLTVPPDFTYKT